MGGERYIYTKTIQLPTLGGWGCDKSPDSFLGALPRVPVKVSRMTSQSDAGNSIEMLSFKKLIRQTIAAKKKKKR